MLHHLYDDNMAVLLLVSFERNSDAAERHARILNIDFAVRRLDNIHKLLQSSHDDILWHLCATVHTFVLELALLCRNVVECSGQLLNMHHLHHLYLYGHPLEVVSMPHHGFRLLNSVRTSLVHAPR